MYDYDLFTIGGGSGGVRASRMAANSAPRSRWPRGATSAAPASTSAVFRRSCSSYASEVREALRTAPGSDGPSASPTSTGARCSPTRTARSSASTASTRKCSRSTGCESCEEKLPSRKQTVVIGSKSFTAAHPGRDWMLAAAAGQFPDANWRSPRTRRFSSASFPARAMVVGGGYIAVEFASIFHGLGAQGHAGLSRRAVPARLRRRRSPRAGGGNGQARNRASLQQQGRADRRAHARNSRDAEQRRHAGGRSGPVRDRKKAQHA